MIILSLMLELQVVECLTSFHSIPGILLSYLLYLLIGYLMQPIYFRHVIEMLDSSSYFPPVSELNSCITSIIAPPPKLKDLI